MRGKHAVWAAALIALAAPAAARAAAPPPIDPQNWSLPDNMTWADYKPIPGPDYADPSIQPTVKKWKVALVVTDFPDKAFALTQPAGGTVFGTPTAEAHDIPRAQVPAFLKDFLNTPQQINHFQTMNRYWMEDTHGRYGVQLDAYGPYQMHGRSYQYFQQDFDSSGMHCPTPQQTPCNRNFRTDARAAWLADVGQTVVGSYDNIFYVSAGEDESSTWQEFGQMKWLTMNDVPEAFGPHAFDPSLTNWSPTRYVPWTSWASSSTIWPNASGNTSIEAESSGMGTYAHELTHNLGIADNYNNPFGTTQQRSATGPWDMMSRGSFGGPGGTHARYLIPPTTGGSLGSQHNLRNKMKLGFIAQNQALRLNRNGLAQSGMAVADVTARAADPGTGLSGIQIALDGANGDMEPPCVVASNPLCDGVRTQGTGITGKFNFYTAEVVQQIGSDSFDPGHGVLLSKTKTSESNSCGTFTCFVWIIDSHPQDINQVDFVGPDGQPRMVTIADQRQLADATFNAGLNSGSSYEYEDTANRLHFYVVDLHKDAGGVLHYTIGVQSLDGNGPQTRGVSLADAPGLTDASDTTCTFSLTNTGNTVATDPALHPQDANAFLTSDVYRLSASSTGTGWSAALANALTTAKAGETVKVPVYVTRAAGSAGNGTVSLTATSVSDPSKTQTAVCGLADGSAGGTVPATLSLSMGTPAAFGPFLPGQGREYLASTTANVISTAGDALLSVADPSPTATGHLVNGAFSLPQALQAKASSPNGTGGDYGAVGGSSAPLSLLTYSGPVSNDAVTVGFKQVIGVNDALRTGTYGKTLTFTLSTTHP
jgi:M6 family metalloprotease-like protein